MHVPYQSGSLCRDPSEGIRDRRIASRLGLRAELQLGELPLSPIESIDRPEESRTPIRNRPGNGNRLNDLDRRFRDVSVRIPADPRSDRFRHQVAGAGFEIPVAENVAEFVHEHGQEIESGRSDRTARDEFGVIRRCRVDIPATAVAVPIDENRVAIGTAKRSSTEVCRRHLDRLQAINSLLAQSRFGPPANRFGHARIGHDSGQIVAHSAVSAFSPVRLQER